MSGGENMKLSYIIPVYNVEKYLRQCVDSILAQNFDDYEIILVDDGSPDNCPAICDEYKEKYPDIVKVIHKGNEGCVIARKVGIKYASGKYLFFADSDDCLVGDNIKKLYDVAENNNLDIVQTSYFWTDEVKNENGITLPSIRMNEVLFHNDMEKELNSAFSDSLIVFLWKNLYRRDFIIENGIDFDEKLRMAGDPPFNMWAYSAAKRFMAVDVPVYCYRIREGSLQRLKYIKDYDLLLNYQWSLKMKYYEMNCRGDNAFYEDSGKYSLIVVLPMILSRAYGSRTAERYKILKRIGNSEMMRRSFKDYDINKFKSKSLDWWMTWCVKYKLYPLAHLICEKVLYKIK